MKISKRVREQAAMMCAISASTPDLANYYRPAALALGLDCRKVRDLNRDPFQLALAAWAFAFRAEYAGYADAEAEALLRTGWSP